MRDSIELDTAVNIFNWLPEGNWLRNIELEGSLDYVATGLPRAGDRIGNELFLDNASGWSFSLVVVIPLAPLSRDKAPQNPSLVKGPKLFLNLSLAGF